MTQLKDIFPLWNMALGRMLKCSSFIIIEKSFLIKISTNVSHRDYPLSTKTWLTFVIMMLTVQTPKDLIIVHVWRGTPGMEEIAMVCL